MWYAIVTPSSWWLTNSFPCTCGGAPRQGPQALVLHAKLSRIDSCSLACLIKYKHSLPLFCLLGGVVSGFMRTKWCVYVCVYVCVCVCVCMCEHVCIYAYELLVMCIHTCMCVCMLVNVCLCVCVCVYPRTFITIHSFCTALAFDCSFSFSPWKKC